MASDLYSFTDVSSLHCVTGNIAVMLGATGTYQFGAKMTLDAIG